MSSSEGSELREERSFDIPRIIDVAGYISIGALVLYTVWNWGPRYFDPYLQSDDTRIVLFPFWSYHSTLFEGDYLAEVMKTWTPLLYRGIVYLLTLFLDLLTVPKVLQLATLAWCGFHAIRMGRRHAGGAGALLGVYLVLHCFQILDRTGGGLPRAFAFPVLFMMLDGLDADRPREAAGATLAGFALYPPAGLIAAAVYGIWSLGKAGLAWRRAGALEREERRRLIELGVTAILCFLVLLPALMPPEAIGRLHTLEEAREMPAFGPEGRLKVLPLQTVPEALEIERFNLALVSDDALLGKTLLPPKEGDTTAFDLILLLALSLVLFRRISGAATPLLIFGVGIAGFVAANGLAFRFYHPGRMITLTLPVAAIGLLIVAFSAGGELSRRPVPGRMMAIGGLGVLVLIQGLAYEGYPHLNVDARPQKPLFELIQSLPEEVMIAGHPERMDNVPLWGKRPILISEETSQPWFTEIWAETQRRLDANLEAYYASSYEPIGRLRDSWPVTHMLVHEDDVSLVAVQHADLFAPYGERMRELAGNVWDRTIWNEAPPASVVGRAAGFTLYDLDNLESAMKGER